MPVEMGFGELVLILAIVVTVFGATRLPQLDELLRRWMSGADRARPRLLFTRASRGWTAVDWLLFGTTAALAAALAVSYATGP
jgi:hypothetical protein